MAKFEIVCLTEKAKRCLQSDTKKNPHMSASVVKDEPYTIHLKSKSLFGKAVKQSHIEFYFYSEMNLTKEDVSVEKL